MSPRPHAIDDTHTGRAAAAFFLVALVVLAFGAWERDLFDADEGRYASVAWAMAQSGDYVTPRLDGMPFMDKPPLVYWIQASLYEVFGPVELAARAPTLLAGALWAWFIYLFAVAWTGSRRSAWAAGLMAATSCAGIIGSRVGPQMDMPLAAAVAGALYMGWRAMTRPSRLHALGLGLAVGLGLLIKGPLAAAVPVLVALAWGLAGGVAWGRVLRTAFSPWAWGVALAVALPWYLLVERAQPGWIAHFIGYEHLGRFAEGDHRAFHPFWFYVPIALVYMAPWTPLAWAGAVGGRWWSKAVALFTCSPWSPRPWQAALSQRPPLGRGGAPVSAGRLAWLWFVVAFVLYSLATRKLLNYLLPAAAPLFVLLGARLVSVLERGRIVAWLMPTALGLAGIGGGLLIAGGLWFPLARGRLPASVEAPRYVDLGPWVIAAGVCMLLPLLVWRLSALPKFRAGALLGCAACFWWCLDLGIARVSDLGSARGIAEAIEAHRGDGAVISLRRYPQGLGFYGADDVWMAGGTPDAWWQREIVNPYARRWWQAHPSHAFSPQLPTEARSGLMTSAEFNEAWALPRPPEARLLLICRWREIQPLGATIVAGPFGGAGRTDLYLVTR